MSDTTPTSVPATAPAPELKTYHGNCHCGAVKYTVTLPEITSVTECDCSLCRRKGHKSLFPSGDLVFEEGKGEDKLKSYEFAGKNIAHKFCPTCGTAVMARRIADGMNFGINARTFNEIDDIFGLKVNTYNGATDGPGYTPHAFTGPEPTATIENAKTYYGSCHCGAITMAFKTAGPLPEGSEKIQQCNCSICTRNGTILTYPHKTQISIHSPTTPPTPLSIYTFGRKFQQHTFCPICGVAISLQKNRPVDPELFKKEAPAGADQKQWEEKLPVNLRCFEGVEWDRVKVENGDWKNYGGKYEGPA